MSVSALDLSEDFFHEKALPSLRESFPWHWRRIGAGLMGNGSECLGFDDDLSRDHDWGIEFYLWLTDEDFAEIGPEVIDWKKELMEKCSREPFRVVSDYGTKSTVMTTGMFYRQFIGLERAPETIAEWRRVPESNFVLCTNGRIFTDPMGEFSSVRHQILQYYPEDLRLKKMAARCLSLAQTGQYNYLRMAQRKDYVTAEITLSRFVQDVISMVFMLNKRYMPYYKWAFRAMCELPLVSAEITPLIRQLYTGEAVPGEIPEGNVITHEIRDGDRSRAVTMELICSEIIKELKRQNLSDADSSFLLQHGESIQGKIRNPQLAALPTQYE